MKLPDFFNFKPLEEARERMKADLSSDMPEVKVGQGLHLSQVEKEKLAAAPGAAPKRAPQRTASAAASAAPAVRVVNSVRGLTRRDVIRLLCAIQLLIMINLAIMFAWLQHRDVPAGNETSLVTPAMRDYVAQQIQNYDAKWQTHHGNSAIADDMSGVSPLVRDYIAQQIQNYDRGKRVRPGQPVPPEDIPAYQNRPIQR